ncbi:LptF/LptG family permease [Maricaulis sp.]|uniref:LptF/LptG family permease n=1 Tax=Maricaulis sp. TaxID=1486257 RepID=UPI00261A45E2|nr:LptF/LptG family permease [Maricaulis sp.]
MILVQRYFFNQLLWPLVTAVAAFAGLALLTQSLSNVDLISGYSETAFTFFKVTMLALPHLTALLVPLALFVAVLSTLNRLTGDSEIVIASAAGMSRYGLIAPVIRLAVYVMIVNLAINLFVQPLAYREMRRSLHELRSDVASSLITPGAFNQVGPGVTIYARERDRDGRMQDILINDTRADERATFTAREGVVVRTGTRSVMVLIDGNRQEIDEAGELFYGTFDRTEFDLGEFIGPVDAMFFKESDRFLHELIWPDAATIARTGGPERAWAEAHYRLSAPLYNLAFALIAAAAFMAGDHSRMGYSRRVMTAVTLGMTMRLIGFAIQSASADDAAVNAGQYLVPLSGVIGALAVIYWPSRRRPGRALLAREPAA